MASTHTVVTPYATPRRRNSPNPAPTAPKVYQGPVAVPPGSPGVAGWTGSQFPTNDQRTATPTTPNPLAGLGWLNDLAGAPPATNSALGGSGSGGGAAAPAGASPQQQVNDVYNQQLKTLAQEVAGGRTSIADAAKALQGTLAKNYADSRGQDAALASHIAGIVGGAAKQSTADQATSAADLQKQGFSASPVLDEARTRQGATTAQGAASRTLSDRFAQLLSAGNADHVALGGAMQTGANNDLTKLNAVDSAQIESQRAQALQQLAATLAKARSGGGGGGGGGSSSSDGLPTLAQAATQSRNEEYLAGLNAPPQSIQDIISNAFASNQAGDAATQRREADLAAELLGNGGATAADQYGRLTQQLAYQKANPNTTQFNDAAIQQALKVIIAWQNSHVTAKPKPTQSQRDAVGSHFQK